MFCQSITLAKVVVMSQFLFSRNNLIPFFKILNLEKQPEMQINDAAVQQRHCYVAMHQNSMMM